MMTSSKHDDALAQKAMDGLLVDLLIHVQALEAVRVTKITRLQSDRPCWYLWTEANQGVYQLELQVVGQVLRGGYGIAKPFLEMKADFVLQYFPFPDTETVAAEAHRDLPQAIVVRLSEGKGADAAGTQGARAAEQELASDCL